MDNETHIPDCQCVVCGDDAVSNGDDDDASRRVEAARLFSIFLRCVSSSSNDEIDSSLIVAERDLLVFNNGNNGGGLVFCSTCKTALTEWDKLYENLRVIIPQKLAHIKYMFYAKILNSSVHGKTDEHFRKNISGHDGLNEGHQSLVLVQQIQRVKDQICRQFSPTVTLKRISSGANESEGRASENLINGFGEDEFEAVSQIHKDDDDDFIESSKPKKDPLSIEDEKTDRGENKRGRKNFVLPNTASKLIGPGKFLYLDKYVFFRQNTKFECAECSAVITQRGHMLRHIREKHVKDESKQLNYLGYRLTADDDGSFSCPVCHFQRKPYHIFKHIREYHSRSKKQHSRLKASKVSVKADVTPEQEKIVMVPLKVEADHDLVAPMTAVLQTESNLKRFENVSSATKDSSFVNNAEQSDKFSTKLLPRRCLRERRRDAIAVDLVDVDDEVSSNEEQIRKANAGHDDDWEIESQGSADDDNDLETNSVRSGDDEGEQIRKGSNVESTKGGESNTKNNTKDVKRYDIVSSGPNEWIYADKYKIIFNSEEGRYYCALCCAVHSERAELIIHIKEKHIDGKLSKADMILRQTGPNEYIYRDRYKVTVDKNDDWHCEECGAQRKNRVSMTTHIRDSHIDPRKRPKKFRTFDEVSPNEFLYYGKYSFRFDPTQELYLCSLCDYTSAATVGVLGHIRTNHCTDADKLELKAVEVAPGEYLYGGRYKILLENGRYRCVLCNRTRETLYLLYPHFRVAHPDGSGKVAEPSLNPSVPRRGNYDAAQKPNALDANKATVPITNPKEARIRQVKERTNLRRAIRRGWKIQGDGKWVYKNNWQVIVQNGKYKCLACDVQEGDFRTTFKHVQVVHAKETGLVRPPVPVRRDVITELEHQGITYTYDPTEEKYTCSICHVKMVERRLLARHIRDKHIDPQKFICDICGQEYDSRLSFRHHRDRHEGPKYACKHCDKRFTAVRYLRTHLKIHMGEDAKKHQCEFCGKKFRSVKELRNHRSSHTGEKPFPCDLCGESFPTTFKRREHRKKVHDGLPQKPRWKPTEGDMVVQPVYSTGEDLTVAEVEIDTV